MCSTALDGLPTPSISHLTKQDLLNVYEPAEDTYLFLDALWHERDFLKITLCPNICVEIGSGTGTLIVALAQLLGGKTFFATDLNPFAAKATALTALANKADINVINTDLLSGLERLAGKIDVLLFNPPYVATSEEELEESLERKDIYTSWAGGIDGVHTLNRLLPTLNKFLSPSGCFYVVVEQENNPKEIAERMTSMGFSLKVIMKRRASNELLYILRFQKKIPPN